MDERSGKFEQNLFPPSSFSQSHISLLQKIQEATASEPLNLSEEYAMQKSWRTDVDKLTFIVCAPLPRDVTLQSEASSSSSSLVVVQSKEYDDSASMLGDVNLFVSEVLDDEVEEE